VTMDKNQPYTGEQTPLVKLDNKESHGFQQSGLAVRKGRPYSGRVILAGSPSATIKVSLVWGDAGSDRSVLRDVLAVTNRRAHVIGDQKMVERSVAGSLRVNPRFPPTILVSLTTSQVLRRPPEVT